MPIEKNEVSDDLKGLGGWLILVGIGLILSPVRSLVLIVPFHLAIIVDQEVWNTLAEVSGWVPLFVMEVSANIVLLYFQVYLIVLFFRKKRAFPKTYILVSIGGFLFLLFDVFLAGLVFPDLPLIDDETFKEIARASFGVAIWVPYMFRSRRVKATFVE